MLFAAQRPWLEAAALMRHPVWQGEGVGDGRRLPVMLIRSEEHTSELSHTEQSRMPSSA